MEVVRIYKAGTSKKRERKHSIYVYIYSHFHMPFPGSNDNGAAIDTFETQLRDLIKANKYFQFSASWCPDCKYANSIWNRYNVLSKIKVFDIATYSQADQESLRSAFKNITGTRNLPTLVVNGVVWGTERELHAHEDAGTLESALRSIGLL